MARIYHGSIPLCNNLFVSCNVPNTHPVRTMFLLVCLQGNTFILQNNTHVYISCYAVLTTGAYSDIVVVVVIGTSSVGSQQHATGHLAFSSLQSTRGSYNQVCVSDLVDQYNMYVTSCHTFVDSTNCLRSERDGLRRTWSHISGETSN